VPDGCDPDDALDIVDGGYFDNAGASQVHDVWAALAPMVAHVNRDRRPDTPRVRPTLVVIETGEGVPVVGTQPPVCGTDGLDAEPDSDDPDSDEPDDDEPPGPLWLGEVLRPFVTALRTGTGSEYFRAQLGASVAAFHTPGIDGRVVTFDLAEHPGRRLPLGWVLAPGSADDIDRQFQLALNQEAAAELGVGVDPRAC
jgi:hypothetical protein